MVSFRNRINCLDEFAEDFLRRLVGLGGYCTALQAEALGIADSRKRVLGRLRMLERLGFLRRVTKYPVVYQVTKSTTRLHGPDSSSRRRHTLATVQARLLGVHFYLEARAWPATFMFDDEEKIMTFQNAGCPLSVLPQRDGKPYLREHFLIWGPHRPLAVAMVDSPLPVLPRLKPFLRHFSPLLQHLREELSLLIVTADKRRAYTYQKLLRTNRTIRKFGLGGLTQRIQLYCVRPPVPTITELTWPKAVTCDWSEEIGQGSSDFEDSHTTEKHTSELIGE